MFSLDHEIEWASPFNCVLLKEEAGVQSVNRKPVTALDCDTDQLGLSVQALQSQ